MEGIKGKYETQIFEGGVGSGRTHKQILTLLFLLAEENSAIILTQDIKKFALRFRGVTGVELRYKKTKDPYAFKVDADCVTIQPKPKDNTSEDLESISMILKWPSKK